MFRAFDLKEVLRFSDPEGALRAGNALNNESRRHVRTKLESFLQSNSRLDGSAMQADWFPHVAADVFISHAHRDEELALMLAGWLNLNLGLRPFVDSCVWGDSQELIEMIDDEYCWNPNWGTYDYKKRNSSTSHVYMMLAASLARMIDKTECAIVLRTSNSITAEEAVLKTKSPWIFMEIATMSTIRRQRSPRRIVKKAKADESLGGLDRDLEIEYMVDMSVFETIGSDTLNDWSRKCAIRCLYGSETLDVLYELVP